jgi:hypothetical protein
MPDFLCKSAHCVGERQGGAIVAKLEAALDAACRRVKFPIGNLGEIGCTLFARERFDAASARNAGTLRKFWHYTFTLSAPLCPTSIQEYPAVHEKIVSTTSKIRGKKEKAVCARASETVERALEHEKNSAMVLYRCRSKGRRAHARRRKADRGVLAAALMAYIESGDFELPRTNASAVLCQFSLTSGARTR